MENTGRVPAPQDIRRSDILRLKLEQRKQSAIVIRSTTPDAQQNADRRTRGASLDREGRELHLRRERFQNCDRRSDQRRVGQTDRVFRCSHAIGAAAAEARRNRSPLRTGGAAMRRDGRSHLRSGPFLRAAATRPGVRNGCLDLDTSLSRLGQAAHASRHCLHQRGHQHQEIGYGSSHNGILRGSRPNVQAESRQGIILLASVQHT